MTANNRTVDRRTVLGSVGGATILALAGCAGDGNGDGAENGSEPDSQNGDADGERTHDLPARGLVYGFTDDSIVAIDPSTHDVIEIERVSGVTWGDIFAGPEHLYAVDSRIDQVHVIDLESATVTATVDVSGAPGHGFYDETTERAYVHADDEATLYGIAGADPTGVESTIELTESGHGKLAVSDDGRVFVSSVSDGGVFSVGLDDGSVEHFDLDGDDHSHHSATELDGAVQRLHGDGGGTHYIQYAPESELVFVEQLDGGHEHSHEASGGIERLHDDDHHDDDHHDDDHHDHSSGETIVFDAAAGEVIGRLEVSGPLYTSDDGELLAIIDGEDIHLIDGTTQEADTVATVPVGGSPGVVRFTDEHVLTVNHSSGDVSFIDRDGFEEVDRLSVSDELAEQGPIGDGRLVTVHDETVTGIDLDAREQEFEVEIPGVRLVQYVPEDATVVNDGRY